LRGPVIGRQNNLDAAVKLALSDPEDADANAIFYAVKVHDELLSRGDGIEAEVATLTGSRSEGITADMNIFNQLREVFGKVSSPRMHIRKRRCNRRIGHTDNIFTGRYYLRSESYRQAEPDGLSSRGLSSASISGLG
jgi:hypothetical protein